MPWWLSAILLLLAIPPAIADGMRCGTKLVMTGDTKIEVLKKCGEPDFKETIKLLKKSRQVNLSDQSGVSVSGTQSRISAHNQTGQSGITLNTETIEAIEQWTYNRGATQFIKLLTFSGGRLESVEEADRGFSE